MIDYTQRLLRRFRVLSPVEAQNRLMAIPDRELALSMMYMEQADRELLFSKISREKCRRIEDELRLQGHLKIRSDQYRRAIELVTARLTLIAREPTTPVNPPGHEPRPAPLRSYLRPLRPRGRASQD